MPTYARREGGAYARGEKRSGLRSGLSARLRIRDLGRACLRGPRLVARRGRCQRNHLAVAAEVLAHRYFEAHRAVQGPGAEGARERGLLLGRRELDEAGDACRAWAVHEPERVNGPEGLAQREDAPGQGVQ